MSSSPIVEVLRRILRRLLRCWRFVTPHYWRLRSNRREVAHKVQSLLPAPYDPCSIELTARATDQPEILDARAIPNSEWSNAVVARLSAKALDRRLATVGAVEIGGWAVHDIHAAFASVDQDVIAAVALRSHNAISSFSDLSHALAPHTVAERITSAFSTVDTYDKAYNSLVGSIGESGVLRHLHEAGVNSDLAPHLNTPEWDLTLWNHIANVKTWGDVSDLSSHFDWYPDTPVVVPADASGIPGQALHFDPATGHGLQAIHDALDAHAQGMVIVDDSLSGHAVHDHLQHAETVATHGAAVAHAHLPFVTIALSGIREFDLLLRGKTDLASAVKNAALDATGTGVGGAAGATVGAHIGTIIWPGVGTAVGLVAGGVYGALKGRAFTGEIKFRPFRQAVAAYETTLSQVQQQAIAYETEAASELNEARSAEESRLNVIAGEAAQRVEETKTALTSWVVHDSCLFPDEACNLVAESLNAVIEVRQSIGSRYKLVSWWRKFFWPDIETLAQQEALRFLRRIERKLKQLSSSARGGEVINRGQLMAVLGAVGVMQNEMSARLEKIYVAQQERNVQARNYLSEVLVTVARERARAEAELIDKLEILKSKIRDAMHPALTNLEKTMERVKSEGGKLGLA